MNGHLVLSRSWGLLELRALGWVPQSSYGNRRAEINRYFAIFSFAVTAWTLSNAATCRSAVPRCARPSLAPIRVRVRINYSDCFPCVRDSFTDFVSQPSSRVLAIFGLAASLFFVASFSPLIVRGATIEGGVLRILYGPLHPSVRPIFHILPRL